MPNNAATMQIKNSEQPNSYPLISVIVPVYNTEKYLAQCVNSILTQTYPNIELILVDDGSKDSSPAMCDDFASKDSRVRVIHKKNGGLSSARNAGLDIARGEFIGLVDSDDFIAPDMYKKLLSNMLQSGAELGICEITWTSHDGKILPFKRKTMPDEILTREQVLHKTFMPEYSYNYFYVWNRLYKAEIFKGLRFPDISRYEDTCITHHLLGACRNAAIISKALYFYRVNPEGLSKSNSLHKLGSPSHIKNVNELKFALNDRTEYFRKNGLHELVKVSQAMASYELLLPMLSKAGYLFDRKEICTLSGSSPLKCIFGLLKTGNYLLMLRAVKLALVWAKSLFRLSAK